MTPEQTDLALRLLGLDRVERAIARGGLAAALDEARRGAEADEAPTVRPPPPAPS